MPRALWSVVWLWGGCVVVVTEPRQLDGVDDTAQWSDEGAPSGKGVMCDRQVCDYESATLSIEHGTLDDRAEVRNDWDLLFGNDQEDGLDRFTVNTVVDDRSWITDLWEVGDLAAIPYDVLPGDRVEDVPLDDIEVIVGHTYVIRTRDDDTAQFAAIRVLEHTVDDSATVQWCRSSDPDGFEPHPDCGPWR